MAILKKIILWIWRLVGYGALLAVVLLAAVMLVGGFTSFGGALVADWVAKAVSTPDRRITISGPGPLLSGNLRVPEIVISDGNGSYAEIHDLAIDWMPSELLSGIFKARRVSAASVSVERRPLVTEVSQTSEQSPFSLPIGIDIEAIDLPLIELGQSLVGKRASLTAKGSVKADSQTIAGTIALNQKGAPDAKLDANLLYAPADNRLQLNTTLSEPQGGILAGLLRLPGEPPVTIALAGDGPITDWRGQLSADVDGHRTIAVTAAHKTLAGGFHHFVVEGNGSFDALLPPSLRPLFSGETQIDLAGTVSETGQLSIETGNVVSGGLQLSASGKLDPAGENDLKANLVGVSGPVDFRLPLAAGEIRAQVSALNLAVTGSAKAARLDLSADIAALSAPQGRLDGVKLTARSDAFDIAAQTGTLATRVTVVESRLSDPSLNRALRAPLTVEAPIVLGTGLIGFDGTTIESASIGGKLDGNYDLQAATLATDFQLFVLPDTLPETIAQKFSGTIGVAGKLTYVQAGAITLDALKITSDTLSADGNVALAGEQLSLKLAGQIADIGIILDNAAGTADFSMSASGPLDRLEGSADVTAAEATLAGRALKNLAVNVQGVADPKAPQGSVKATGTLDGQTIGVNADMLSANGQTRIPALAVTVGPNRLDGALELSAQFIPSGNLTFDFPDVGLLAALAGQSAAGDLRGTLALRDNGGRIGADIKATGGKLARDGVTITVPAIDLAIADAGNLAMQGTVRAQRLAQANNGADDIVLTFERSAAETAFDLMARYDGAPVTAKGNVAESGTGLKLALESLSAAPRGVALSLARPARIAIVDGAAVIEAMTIAAGGGTVDIKGRAGSTLDLGATIKAVPASLANTFAPTLGATGLVSGTVNVKGSPATPVVDYVLDWSGAGIAQTQAAGLAPSDVDAKGRFEGGKLTVDTRVTSPGGLVLQGGGSVETGGGNGLSLKFNGNLPFGVLAGQLSRQGFVAEGTATLDVGISGSTAAPVFSGTITTRDARLIDVRRNLAVEGIAATISLDRSRATISSLTGKLAGGGSVKGSGTIDITSPGLPADISIALDKATYVDGKMLNTAATGALTLRGPLLTAPVLAGKIALGETAITIPERLPTSLAELDISHKNASSKVRQQMAEVMHTEQNGSASSIGLDLALSTPSQVFVRGRGIDAELGGDLVIRGTSAEPSVSGAFTLRRGRLSILTKRLDITSGTITFGGGLIPLLNLVASTTSGSTTVTITISGLANDPSIAFSSAPALPQDEILAQLIFGQSMAKLSALQIAQLADAASQLAGGRSTSLFSSLRNSVGVDDLDISTDDTGQATVTAGKYLNDRTYLELKQGGTGGGKAVINLDIGRGVKLRGEAGSEGGGAGIFYEKEY